MSQNSEIVKSSLLLSMPAEIRNQIYEEVIKSEWGNNSPNYFVLDRPLPALFRINRQIRHEALDVFLLKNHFHVYTSKIGFKWLRILGHDLARFRYLTLFIDISTGSWLAYLNALLPMVSVYLELRIRKAAASLSDFKVAKFLRETGLSDCHKWNQVVISDSEFVFKRVEAGCLPNSNPT